jgi:hypothetical protein
MVVVAPVVPVPVVVAPVVAPMPAVAPVPTPVSSHRYISLPVLVPGVAPRTDFPAVCPLALDPHPHRSAVQEDDR